MRTYTIELRVDFSEKENYELLLTSVREAAKGMLTTAVLLSDKRKPQIALQTGDLFEGNEDIALFGEGEE